MTTINKPFLVGGIIAQSVALCIIFPIEYNKAQYITDFPSTFLGLAVAVPLVMYGMMGNAFVDGLTLVLSSAIFSFFAWVIFAPDQLSSSLFTVLFSAMLGLPSGLIAGLIFLVVNHQFISDENRKKLLFKRVLAYLVILFFVSLLFYRGADWIYEISDYFKGIVKLWHRSIYDIEKVKDVR